MITNDNISMSKTKLSTLCHKKHLGMVRRICILMLANNGRLMAIMKFYHENTSHFKLYTDRKLSTTLLGPIVRKPIKCNPRLKVNRSFLLTR